MTVLTSLSSLAMRDRDVLVDWIAQSARLATLSRMVAAAADEDDMRRCSTVAHRYMAALVTHLRVCGPTTWDGDDGLRCATQQLLLLTADRRVIASTIAGPADVRAANDLVTYSAEYDDMTRRATSRIRPLTHFGAQP